MDQNQRDQIDALEQEQIDRDRRAEATSEWLAGRGSTAETREETGEAMTADQVLAEIDGEPDDRAPVPVPSTLGGTGTGVRGPGYRDVISEENERARRESGAGIRRWGA